MPDVTAADGSLEQCLQPILGEGVWGVVSLRRRHTDPLRLSSQLAWV